jgi:hypothetical protein
MVLRRLWIVAVWPQPESRRSDRHSHGSVRQRSRHPTERPAVRGLRSALGADPRRRAALLPRESPRQAVARLEPRGQAGITWLGEQRTEPERVILRHLHSNQDGLLDIRCREPAPRGKRDVAGSAATRSARQPATSTPGSQLAEIQGGHDGAQNRRLHRRGSGGRSLEIGD